MPLICKKFLSKDRNWMPLALLGILTFTGQAFAAPPPDNFTVGADGWTRMAPSSDSRLVYVDPSHCSASASYYSLGDPAVGSDARNPVNMNVGLW